MTRFNQTAMVMALCVAALMRRVASFSEECWGMGQTCGDGAHCSGIGSHCGDRSKCSGSSSTCGAFSVCTGLDSECGPNSECAGLGSRCAGGSTAGHWQQQQSSDDSWKPMKWKWEFPTEKPAAHVYVHGCDQGEVCNHRPGMAESGGVKVCCGADCSDCSASSSQADDVLTATCVCNNRVSVTPAPRPQAPPAAQGVKVIAKGCETGDVCLNRPGAAEANGMAFCCPAYCAECMVYGTESDGVLNAMCVCGAQQLAEEATLERTDMDALFVPLFIALFLAAFAGMVFAAMMVSRRMFGRRSSEGWQPLLA